MSLENKPRDSIVRHDVFLCVADPTRRAILQMLAGGEMSIASIKVNFPVSRNAIIKHLKILSDAGLVCSHRSGRETLYSFNQAPLLELKSWLTCFDGYWDEKLSSLKRYIEKEGERI